MSRRASRPGMRSEPEPPELIVAEAFPEPEPSACSAEQAEPPKSTRRGPRTGEPVIPTISPSDDPRRWGDGGDSNDQRLRDGVPPHW